MIGPRVEGFRTGERVKVAAPQNVHHGRTGYITMITEGDNGARFFVQFDGETAAAGFNSKQLERMK
jgi:hypothetical protein